jgi:FK506-binding protein 2
MKKTLLPGALAALVLLATFVSLTFTQTIPLDGLKIETTKAVACIRKSKAGDKLNVHYRGTLVNGVEFDSSYGRNEPFQFTLGVGQVIKGWDKGMADMCPGEGRRLTVPPNMGYGSRNMGAIPPNSVLSTFGRVLDTESLI